MNLRRMALIAGLATAPFMLAGAAHAGVLASEDFNGVTYPNGSSAVPLNGVNDGTGFSGAWVVQNGNASIPGYNVSNANPISGGDNSNYATGGNGYQGSGRPFDTSNTGTFGSAGLVNAGTFSTIGGNGQTLLFSALMRIDNTSGDPKALTLGNVDNNSYSVANVYMGYLDANANHDWTLSTSNGGGSVVTADSNVAFTVGTAAELVTKIAYNATGTGATLSLYVNPSNPLNPSGPANATLVTTDGTFQHLQYDAGYAPGESSFTNLSIQTAVPEPATLGILGLGALGLLRRRRKA